MAFDLNDRELDVVQGALRREKVFADELGVTIPNLRIKGYLAEITNLAARVDEELVSRKAEADKKAKEELISKGEHLKPV